MSNIEANFGITNNNETTNIKNLTSGFLNESIDKIDTETIKEIEDGAQKHKLEIIESLKTENYNKYRVDYDRREKSFVINGESYSLGQIVSARRWGNDFYLPEELNNSGDGKKLIKILIDKKVEDKLYKDLNKELSINMTEATKKVDLFISKAYEKLSERQGIESEQIGVVAEKVMLSALERISIDRSDLGIHVRESNAVEDVKDKIDFIISAKHKVRGVGINRDEISFEEKSIGIQFTTNLSKKDNKIEQISKSKDRGVAVDDIIYVEIDPKILSKAINDWNTGDQKIKSPFEHLEQEIQNKIYQKLLEGIINEDQLKSFKNK